MNRMAYDPQRGGGRGYGQQAGGYINRGYGQRGGWNDRTNTPYDQPKPIEPRKLPANYVDEAERVMNALKAENKYGNYTISCKLQFGGTFTERVCAKNSRQFCK